MPNLLALKLTPDEIWIVKITSIVQPRKWPNDVEVLFMDRELIYKLLSKLRLSQPKNITARNTLMKKIDTARQREIEIVDRAG